MKTLSRGFTLVEIMIAVAILSILTALAIPAYNGYITTARDAVVRANVEPLRFALEDFFLDNNTYVAGTWLPAGAKTLETGALGWRPDGDEGNFNYTVAAPAGGAITTGYALTVTNATFAAATVTCDRDQAAGTFVCI